MKLSDAVRPRTLAAHGGYREFLAAIADPNHERHAFRGVERRNFDANAADGLWCMDHGRVALDGAGRVPCHIGVDFVPFKANAERRHHIPKQRYRATNSAAYDAALRQRGSLTVWFTDEAIAAWKSEPRTTRGGRPRCSGAGDRDGADVEGYSAWHYGRPKA